MLQWPAGDGETALRAFGQGGKSSARTAILPLAVLAMLSGCSAGGAPSISFFGAYFPAWLLAALCGTAVAILARIFLVAAGLAGTMPWQLAVCTSIGLIAAIALHLLVFG